MTIQICENNYTGHIPLVNVQFSTNIYNEAIFKWFSVVHYCAQGKERLAGCLGITPLQAGQFIESFLVKHKKIHDFTKKTIEQCHNEGNKTYKIHSCLPFSCYATFYNEDRDSTQIMLVGWEKKLKEMMKISTPMNVVCPVLCWQTGRIWLDPPQLQLPRYCYLPGKLFIICEWQEVPFFFNMDLKVQLSIFILWD